MARIQDVAKFFVDNAGALVAVRIFNEAGLLVADIEDEIATDFKADGDAFVWHWANDEKAHAIKVDKIERDGDEFFLHTPLINGQTRVVRISPMWQPGHRDVAIAWNKRKNQNAIGRVMEAMHAAALQQKPDKSKSTKVFQAAWLAIWDTKTQELVSAGVMVLGPRNLIVRTYPEHRTAEAAYTDIILLAAARGINAKVTWDYLLERDSGIAEDFSKPFEVRGENIEAAADAALAQTKTRGDLLS